ncbi:VIT domain-containing protein, partial [Noviluteimonas dokdonensis]|uniref:VIT domain-containing protein n=1 Tax=Noviluteimonas dokdonensis TaxID=414050 RepID=UPI0023519729
MQRTTLAAIACAITFVLGFSSPVSQAQNVTAPLVRIGGDAQGLQPIQVRRVEAKVDVAGRLSRRTLTFELRNPNARLLEGTLEFPLAAGQQISGFALDIGGEMREAVPVPKDKGRQVFESIERRGVDPGLLEQTAGNNFRVRVYPIPANGTRRVRLVIDETVERRQSNSAAYAARRDNGDVYVLGEVPIGKPILKPRVVPKRIGLLWDASASERTRDRAQTYALLDRYFAAMGEGRVTLRILRDVGEDGGTFEIRNGQWHALRKKLDATVEDGATDLADWIPTADIDEYLLVSDGQRNYGETEVPRLEANQRLYAISTTPVGGDPTRLAVLAQQRNGRLVDASGKGLFDEAPRIVGLAPHGVTDLEVPGRFVDDFILRVAGRATQPGAYVDVTVEGAGGRKVVRVDMPIDGSSHPQIAALWAGWKVRALSADPERNAARIARIGQEFGIVTPGTSLLVLENVDDYVTYDIPPPPALRAEVAELRKMHTDIDTRHRTERIDSVADKFVQRIAWWERKFPKDLPARAKIAAGEEDQARDAVSRREVAAAAASEQRAMAYAPAPAPA